MKIAKYVSVCFSDLAGEATTAVLVTAEVSEEVATVAAEDLLGNSPPWLNGDAGTLDDVELEVAAIIFDESVEADAAGNPNCRSHMVLILSVSGSAESEEEGLLCPPPKNPPFAKTWRMPVYA